MLPIYLCEDVVNQLIYLEKLISNYILKEALALYSSIGNTVQKTLTLKIGSRYIYVPIQNIYCIKANEHKLLLMTDYSSYEFYDTLQNILLRLDSSFLLCHKSCIVNLRYIMELDKFSHSIQLKNGQSCPLSSRNYFTVKKRLNEFINLG